MSELESPNDFGILGWHNGPYEMKFNWTEKSFRNFNLHDSLQSKKKKKEEKEGKKKEGRKIRY